VQAVPLGQTVPQLPQLLASLLRVMQTPLQSVAPVGQVGLQAPAVQVVPLGQTVPQLPQLRASLLRVTQAPAHAVVPGSHAC
jgi:hypothetical protein